MVSAILRATISAVFGAAFVLVAVSGQLQNGQRFNEGVYLTNTGDTFAPDCSSRPGLLFTQNEELFVCHNGEAASVGTKIVSETSVVATRQQLMSFVYCNGNGDVEQTISAGGVILRSCVCYDNSTAGHYSGDACENCKSGWTLDDGSGLCTVADQDGDLVPDSSDNCPTVANADQSDQDSDGKGDVCDDDGYRYVRFEALGSDSGGLSISEYHLGIFGTQTSMVGKTFAPTPGHGTNPSSTYSMVFINDGVAEVTNGASITYWPSYQNADFYVDLVTPALVTDVYIAPQGTRGVSAGHIVTAFNVYGSLNLSDWIHLASFSGITQGVGPWNPGTFRRFQITP